jgi:hypothetical protein
MLFTGLKLLETLRRICGKLSTLIAVGNPFIKVMEAFRNSY